MKKNHYGLPWLGVLCMICFGIVVGCEPTGTVYSGDYKIRNVADLKALSGYTEVTGDLLIGKAVSTLINLDGLESLTTIGGMLGIGYALDYMEVPMRNPLLQNIDGLRNLTSVGGEVLIYENQNLKNVNGLSSLKTIGGRLYISTNPSLTNLDSLDCLIAVGGRVLISSNDALTSIKGLKNLTIIDQLDITDNMLLADLEGLNQLATVNKSANIGVNAALTNIDALTALSSVGGSINISGNDALINLSGLNNLTTAGKIDITHNQALTNIGLNHLAACSYLRVWGNNSLTDITGIADLLSINGAFIIKANTALQRITGFNNLTTIGGDFSIIENTVLAIIDGLGHITSVNGNLYMNCNDAALEPELLLFKDRLTADGWTGCWDFTCDDTKNLVCPATE